MTTEIEELKKLSKEDLIKKWKKIFKTNSPQHAKRDFMIKHIAWELQARKYGGYSPQVQKQLDKLAEQLAKSKSIEEKDINFSKNISELEIKPGTKLVREFKGEKHEVIVLKKGFEYMNKTYKSLSAIANEITGTRWNGKVFFGIKK